MNLCKIPPVLFLLLFPAACFAIWKCDKSAVQTRAPCDKFNGEELSAKDEKLLLEAMATDGFAEYKYRYECYTAQELAEQAKVDLATRGQDLDDWDEYPECDPGHYPLHIPGHEEMAFGYNLVSDESSQLTSHSPILNMRDSSKFRSAILDPRTNKCYVVPDALVSDGADGVFFNYKSSFGFDAMAARSLAVYRENQVRARKIELGLGSDVPFAASLGAGFSTSEKVNWFKTENSAEEENTELVFVESTHFLNLQTALPTKEIIAEWRDLYFKKNTTQAYLKYFSEFGTHYHVHAQVGGRYTLVFTAKKSVQRSATSTIENRAACIALQASAILGVAAATNGAECAAAFDENFSSSHAKSIMQSSHAVCEGGYRCPRDTTDPKQFNEWRENIVNSSVLLGGSKKWIHQLIEHVVTRAGKIADKNGDPYRKVVLHFARPELDLKKGLEILEGFGKQLRLRVVEYLEANKFCEDPGNCSPGLDHPIVEGVAKTGWGSWHQMDECDTGQVAKIVKRFIEPENWGDWSGLNRIELRCGEPGSGEASTRIISSGSSEWGRAGADEACLDGYLDAMRLYSVEDRGSGYDNYGVTDVQFKCVSMATGNSRSLPERVVVSQAPLPWASGWRQCPERSAICGIQTLVQANQGNGDDTAINNVRIKCCRVPGKS